MQDRHIIIIRSSRTAPTPPPPYLALGLRLRLALKGSGLLRTSHGQACVESLSYTWMYRHALTYDVACLGQAVLMGYDSAHLAL